MTFLVEIMTSDTHSAEVLAQRKRIHVIWGRWWGLGLPLGIEFTEHAHVMATTCFRGTPPRAQCEWPISTQSLRSMGATKVFLKSQL